MESQPVDQFKEIVRGVVADRADIAVVLSRAVALSMDVGLRDKFRTSTGASPGEAFAMRVTPTGAWLRLEPDGTHHAERLRPSGMRTLDDDGIESGSDLDGAFARSINSSLVAAEVGRLLDPLFRRAPLMSREQFAALNRWAPALEHLAFRGAMRLSELVDALRPTVKRELEAGVRDSDSLTVYWDSIHAMARLFLLAGDPEARPWLADMAASFTWSTWTPSFVLLRERTAWLAAVAARSAMAFGEAVVDGYLRALSDANSPMRAFDALFGLTAIALGSPRAAGPILTATHAVRVAAGRASSYQGVVDLGFAHALDLMSKVSGGKSLPVEEPPPALKWSGGTPSGLGTRPALLYDPSIITERGMAGLSMLPFVVSTRIDEHFPRARALRTISAPRAGEQAAVLRRTWVPEDALPARSLN